MEQEKTKEYWENLIKTTKHKVIGYTNTVYGSDHFIPITTGNLTDEEYAAIIKDYRKNGYLYSGEDYQDSLFDCTPVLDNYRCVDFSRRGFGGLIARSKGDYSEMGYCHYTEQMFINHNDLKFPKGGLNKGITRQTGKIDIDEEIYYLIKDERKNQSKALITIPLTNTNNAYYWIDDGVTLCFEDKIIKAKIRAIANYKNEEEFIKFIENRRIKCIFTAKILKKTPLLLISL